MRTRLAALILLTSCSSASLLGDDTTTGGRPLQGFSKTGGSVFAFFSVGAYPDDPRPEIWDRDVRSILNAYHLDPASVRARLRAMKDQGQRRVGIVLWFVAPEPGGPIARGHYVIPRADYSLAPQHQANLLAFLDDLDALGFEEVQIRFGQQGGAMWECFENPACYSQGVTLDNPHFADAVEFNWSFRKQIVDLVEGRAHQVKRLYDIAPEYMGINYMATRPRWREFTRAMWQRYVTELKPRGIEGTISFNHADYAGTEASLQVFDELGWPSTVAIDLYYGLYGNLGNFADALKRHGHGTLPVFVQETYANDTFTADEFVRARDDFGLNLTHVMQWPQARGSDLPIRETAAYDVYLSLPTRTVAPAQPARGSIVASPATCLVPAGGTACSSTLTWSTTGVTHAEVRIEDSALLANATSGTSSPDWVPLQYVRFDLWGDGVYLGSARVNGVPAGTPVGGATGHIEASPCAILPGATTCTSTVSWSTSGATDVEVKIGSALFARAPSGSQAAPWITQAPAQFELWADGAIVDRVTVAGAPDTLLKANPPVCQIPAGGSLCTSTLSWNVPGAADVQVKIGGQLFAHAASGTQPAPWISESPASFELWVDGVKRETLVVRGTH